jgi:hypothetical protein
MSDNLARVMRPSWQAGFSSAAPETPAPPAERRHIEIVSTRSQRKARPRIVYALSAVAGMAAIVVAQLLLSVGISQGAYEISSLQSAKVELGRTADGVTEDLVRASSPQNLAANAEALGMVANANPVYLRLSDGAVLGAPASAPGAPPAAELVPNALLAGVPLVTDLQPSGAQGTGVGAPKKADSSVSSPVTPATPAVTPTVADGLPTPTTR